MAYDMAVVNTAYSVARSMGASDKVMLALFEAAIVESGFRNLNYGADDSVGYLQQRPSQGWPNPMDVPTATRSFVSKAIPLESRYTSAGLLAQAVQRSAFPLKYNAVILPAAKLLNDVKGSPIDVKPSDSGGGDSLSNVNRTLDFLTDRNTYIRASMFIGGVAFLFYGLVKLSGADPVAVAKTVVTKGVL